MTSPGAPELAAAPETEPADALVTRHAPPHPLRTWVRGRAGELARFGSVGAVAFVVDMGVYNLLCFGPVGVLATRPLTARVIAVAVSTMVSWLGNRLWTFADRRGRRRGREFVLFAGVNVLGIVISVATLAFSRYLLGLDGPLADNVANVIGVGLGTIARYVGYRMFVFNAAADPTPSPHRACAARGDGATAATDPSVAPPA
ncbi:MAG TPA: GtrA family protein [Cellulomonas sp.]